MCTKIVCTKYQIITEKLSKLDGNIRIINKAELAIIDINWFVSYKYQHSEEQNIWDNT